MNLAQGVARLHSWYQVTSLVGVLLLIWYSEEVARLLPPYAAITQVIMDPIFNTLRVDMYLSSDYQAAFRDVLLRHKMLMIVQCVVLSMLYAVLRRASRSRGDLNAVTTNRYTVYAIQSLEYLEVMLFMKGSVTKEVLLGVIPKLDAPLAENLYAPLIQWGAVVWGIWWVHVVPAVLIAFALRFGELWLLGKTRTKPQAVRLFFVSFTVAKLAVSGGWFLFARDSFFLGRNKSARQDVLPRTIFWAMGVKALVVHCATNLQKQKETYDLSQSGMHHPAPAAEIAPIATASELTVLYLTTSRVLLFRLPTLMVGCLSLLLSANTLALFVVILAMYLVLIWTPAAIAVFSVDYFFHFAGAVTLSWLKFAYVGGSSTYEEQLYLAAWLFVVILAASSVLAYVWNAFRLSGMVALVVLFTAFSDWKPGPVLWNLFSFALTGDGDNASEPLQCPNPMVAGEEAAGEEGFTPWTDGPGIFQFSPGGGGAHRGVLDGLVGGAGNGFSFFDTILARLPLFAASTVGQAAGAGEALHAPALDQIHALKALLSQLVAVWVLVCCLRSALPGKPDSLPSLFTIFRRYVHATVAAALVFTALFVSYLVPTVILPSGVRSPLIAVLALFLLGFAKENEAGIRVFLDAAIFNIPLVSDDVKHED
ncbi:hypothetical protein DIPPA_16454 [Diplonema papillatum]|nr:hypothetical protein DIPPA_16454 [Diplonema papillatum]